MSSSAPSPSSAFASSTGPRQAQTVEPPFAMMNGCPPPPAPFPAGASPSSWSSLKASVRESRRALSGSVAQMRTPAQFVFRPLPELLRTRLYFLSSVGSRESILLYVDLDDSAAPFSASDAPLVWTSLIEQSFQQVLPSSSKPSKEEQLMSERKRCVAWGITEYECHQKSGKFVFPVSGALFACVDPGSACPTSCAQPPPPVPTIGSSASPSSFQLNSGGVIPFELKTHHHLVRLNPTLCPANPDLVAFVGNFDVWVSSMSAGQEVRLTHSHKLRRSLAEDPISCGLPSYVMQEEFNRFSGVWWRPTKHDNAFQLLYEEVDESDVELLMFPSSSSAYGEMDEFRFPRAGANNAKSTLRMVEFSIFEATGDITDVTKLELRAPLTDAFPWMEYIVRVGWTPDGRFIWCQLLDRRQKKLQLVLISPDSFVAADDSSLTDDDGGGGSGVKFQVIASVTSEGWVSVNDTLVFLESDDPASTVRFVWATEETGFRHLYLMTAHLGSLAEGEDRVEDGESATDPKVLSKEALTSGSWPVSEERVWVDEGHGLVFFTGYKDTPLEKHLYVASLVHPGDVRRLTSLGVSHSSIEMNENCTMFVSVYSSINTLPASQIVRIGHKDSTVDGVVITPAGWVVEPKDPDSEYQSPELFNCTISSGDTLYGMVFKPSAMEAGKRYPVVLSVYGGPEVQLVNNTFKGCRQIRNHLLASQGFVVVCVDSRGSQNRGSAFESHLRLRMGQVEMKDQVEALLWLAKVVDYLDMDRVAVHGWSYGGYLSLMALVQFPEIFKVSVAGAPVVTWSHYDTGYTERYMDLPHFNAEGYKNGSVLSRVADFPDEPNRLLIVHGLMDENVHFYHHTNRLITQLIKHGKPYQLQVYPGERHSLRHFEASEHYETTLLSFLKMNL